MQTERNDIYDLSVWDDPERCYVSFKMRVDNENQSYRYAKNAFFPSSQASAEDGISHLRVDRNEFKEDVFYLCKGGMAERYSSYFYEFCLSRDKTGGYQIIVRDLEGYKGALQTVPEYVALLTGIMPRHVTRKFGDQIENSEAMQRTIKEKVRWKVFQDTTF